jgi:hypothetical protein
MTVKETSIFVIVLILLICQLGKAWDVDFSHHSTSKNNLTTTTDTSDGLVVRSAHEDKNVGERQELVILNTPKGFIPSHVSLHKGLHYKVFVVNVNEEKKNVSFILDGFDQHYATYYGQIKSFTLDPDKEGIFEFECPETTSLGKVVVFGPGKSAAPVPVAPPTHIPAAAPLDIERLPSSEN